MPHATGHGRGAVARGAEAPPWDAGVGHDDAARFREMRERARQLQQRLGVAGELVTPRGGRSSPPPLASCEEADPYEVLQEVLQRM